MIFRWWRNRRRRRILSRPFPADWESLLRQNVRHYASLSEAEQKKLRECVQVFVHEKYWEGCKGLEVTDEMRVTIAGHACLLLLGFEDWCFDNLQTVLIYPDEYFARQTEHLPGGVVAESMSMRLGEAWQRGPVILAWSSVLRDIHPPQSPRRGRRSEAGRGQNVVLHEFAHVLDMQDLDADGMPPLASAGESRNWQQVMTTEYNRLLEDTERGRPTLLDEYGTVSPAEFFAVATECFFELPALMQERHPRLYELFAGFYRQDPARRTLVAATQDDVISTGPDRDEATGG